ncbi:MAG: DNA repair protein RecO [Candidatus Tokpelaia sp.]|nr:MAG: DNA repair protein RecO [Candidatus Tokpelaia sp.]KAA6206924.1 MAG: DNA repair protein RecO [Candidatus Tokpelaia sp.]
MEWQDEGFIIGLKQHGETGLIVELITPEHGRHKGLVRGGQGRRLSPLMQAGNRVKAQWRARLSEHMGQYRLEAVDFAAARLMQKPLSLYALQNVTSHLRLLPERDPHPALYRLIPLLFEHFDRPLLAGEIFVRFEMRLLEELGFGLDLSRCAATGKKAKIMPVQAGQNNEALPRPGREAELLAGHISTAEPVAKAGSRRPVAAAASPKPGDREEEVELAYVSPKSGRAVSFAAGAPWRDKLLSLPPFLLAAGQRAADFAALQQAFQLTGFFLARHVWEPRGLAVPLFRAAFLQSLQAALAEDKRQAV